MNPVARILSRLLLVAPLLASAQEQKLVSVEERVSLAIPGHWAVLDDSQRQAAGVEARQLFGATTAHVPELTAAWRPNKVRVRVSILKGIAPFTQAQLDEHGPELADTVRSGWRDSENRLWATFAQSGIHQIGDTVVAVRPLGGARTVVIEYAHSGLNGHAGMRVTQYHVPLGPEKALITLWVALEDEEASAAAARLLESIRIQ